MKAHDERFEFEAICFDVESSDHRYTQLERQLREAISTGVLRAGSRVPSSRSLSKSLNVSRNTVIAAYTQLISEGYLDPCVGSGTRVATMPPEAFEHGRPCSPAKRKELGADALSSLGRQFAKESKLLPLVPGAAMPFLPHLPAVDVFPIDIWNRLMNEQARWSTKHLHLCDPQGFLPLRESLAEYMAVSRGVACAADQVVITAGAQQATTLTAQLLLEQKDRVWVEDPGNTPANRLFEQAGARVEGFPLDSEGIDLRGAENRKSPKLISVTPGCQWPLTMTMSLSRRLELLALARQSQAWVLEDDYNSEFRYSGRPHPSLCSLDKTGRTIYLGTFSKMLFPAIRLAFLIVPSDLAPTFAYAKWLQDRGSPPLTQMVLHRFIETGNFVKHLRRMRTLYAERQRVLYEGLKKHFGNEIRYSLPDSGMHLVIRGRTKKVEAKLIAAARRAKIQFHLVKIYSQQPDSDSARGIILGFAGYDTQSSKRALRNWIREYKLS